MFWKSLLFPLRAKPSMCYKVSTDCRTVAVTPESHESLVLLLTDSPALIESLQKPKSEGHKLLFRV